MCICPATCVRNSLPPSVPAAPMPATSRPCAPCSPRTSCPATSTRNLGAPWIPATDIQAFAADALRRAASTPSRSRHLATEALWSLDGGPSRACRRRRHHRLRHRPRRWRDAAGAGPQPEKPHDLRPHHGAMARRARPQPRGNAGRPREAESHQGALSRPGSSPIPSARNAWCASTTTPTTTSACASSMAPTSTFPA